MLDLNFFLFRFHNKFLAIVILGVDNTYIFSTLPNISITLGADFLQCSVIIERNVTGRLAFLWLVAFEFGCTM